MGSGELTARVVFPATAREHRLAVLRVRLEDVGLVDAPAVVLGETGLSDVVVPAEGTAVTVPVALPVVDGRARVTVRAHGSVSGSTGYASGDFLTTRSVPVGTTENTDAAVVDVPVELLP